MKNAWSSARDNSTAANAEVVQTRRAGAGFCTLIAAAVVLVVGCASPASRLGERAALLDRAPTLNERLFAPARQVPDFAEMVALTPSQEADFLRFFNSGRNARHEPHRRVYAYLTRHLADTDFQHRTLPASVTIETRSGNCMSLALVTSAYARLAGVKIGWQLADTDPVYSSQGSVVFSADHIQTRLYHPGPDIDSKAVIRGGMAYLLVDYYTDTASGIGKPLDEMEMRALVFQNLAGEAMAEGELEESFWLLKAGLKHDPANSDLYNAMAVLHRRVGDAQTAEALYRFTLDEFGDRLIVLRNYRTLLLAEDREDEAYLMERRIMALPDPDPYPLLSLGDEAAAEGKTSVALAYYNKARELAPYLHETYLRIARIHAENGNLKRARHALRKARDNAWAAADQRLYSKKLSALDGR